MRVLGSITNRIFLASALLAMLSIAAAVYFVSAQLTSQTEAELERDLTEAATLVIEQRHTQFDNVARTGGAGRGHVGTSLNGLCQPSNVEAATDPETGT